MSRCELRAFIWGSIESMGDNFTSWDNKFGFSFRSASLTGTGFYVLISTTEYYFFLLFKSCLLYPVASFPTCICVLVSCFYLNLCGRSPTFYWAQMLLIKTILCILYSNKNSDSKISIHFIKTSIKVVMIYD